MPAEESGRASHNITAESVRVPDIRSSEILCSLWTAATRNVTEETYFGTILELSSSTHWPGILPSCSTMSLSTSLKSRTSARSALSEIPVKKEPEILQKNAKIPPAEHSTQKSSLPYMPTALTPTSSGSAGVAGSLLGSSRPRRTARDAAVDVHASEFESASFQQGFKRERQSLEPSSNSKILKAEPLESDIKVGTSGEADSEVQRRKIYQSLVQEVCLYGSSPKCDASQSGSPKTPPLSHFTAQHMSQFVESFICAFPSECDELFILLDAFQERRFVVKFCL